MNAKPNSDEIIELLKKSGYLMEQAVATQLEDLGYHVETNWAFEDVDLKKSREIDVRAIKRVAYNKKKNIYVFVEILVECKNSANPLIFITRKKNRSDRKVEPEEFVAPIQNYEMTKKLDASREKRQSLSSFLHLRFDKVHYDYLRESKAVQFCRITRKGKNWEANHGGFYDSIILPLAKAVSARKKELSTHSSRTFWLFVPMVVVSGEMYSVDSMQPSPKLLSVDSISFKREIRSGNLDGRFTIEFTRQDCIADFVGTCIDPLIAHAKSLAMRNADFVLRKEVPWRD
ncbi:MAG: hypothetical protein OXM59_01135 [Gammaproteobacteria bacterium]|nr:hypothetical protein [Gammaproteobacteria bacterium]